MERLGIDKKQEKPDAEQKSSKRTILPAEKKFNWRVYGGLNYAVQVTTAVLATEWIKHGGGKKAFDKAAEWTGKNIIPVITNKRGVEAVKDANTYLIGTALLSIGNAFLIPVKMLENRKASIVRKIDEKLTKQQEAKGFIITPEERERHEKALVALENEPKLSWPSLVVARAAGFGSFYLSRWLIGGKNDAWMQSKTADGVQYALKNSGVDGLKKVGKSQRVRNFSKIAFIDFFYSIGVATTVFVVGSLLTKKKTHKDIPSQLSTEVSIDTPDKKAADTSSGFVEKELSKKQPNARASLTTHKNFSDYVSASASNEPQVSV